MLNIEATKDGLVEKLSGRKVISPLDQSEIDEMVRSIVCEDIRCGGKIYTALLDALSKNVSSTIPHPQFM